MTDREHLRRVVADAVKLMRALDRFTGGEATQAEYQAMMTGEHLMPLRKSTRAATEHLGEN